MSWTRLDDNMFEDPVYEEIGPEAVALHITALCHVARILSDGHLDRRHLRKLYPVRDLDAALDALVESGLWQPTDAGWFLNTWATHVRSRDVVEAEREANRKRQANFVAARKANKAKRDAEVTANAVSDGVSDGVTNNSPTRPDPSRPEGRDGKGRVGTEPSTVSSLPERREKRKLRPDEIGVQIVRGGGGSGVPAAG